MSYLEKKEAGTRAGQEEQEEAVPACRSWCSPAVLFQVVTNMQPHCASTASLGLILHLFLGALDFISIFKALDSGKKRREEYREKRIRFGTHSMALRHH